MNPILPISCPVLQALSHDPDKRRWLIATGVAGGVAALATAVPLFCSFAPNERANAAGGPVEVDIIDIPPGGAKTVAWRGKPVCVVRRTPEMLDDLQGPDAALADPASAQPQQPEGAHNPARSIKLEVFVEVGICTHLGCSPTCAASYAPPQPAGRLARRILLPLPRLHL